jgi:hypothetical protein
MLESNFGRIAFTNRLLVQLKSRQERRVRGIPTATNKLLKKQPDSVEQRCPAANQVR